MDNSEELESVFTGNQHEVFLLKGMLEENGIASIIKNGFESGVSAGFMGGNSSAINLLVSNHNLEKTMPIVEAFNIR